MKKFGQHARGWRRRKTAPSQHEDEEFLSKLNEIDVLVHDFERLLKCAEDVHQKAHVLARQNRKMGLAISASKELGRKSPLEIYGAASTAVGADASATSAEFFSQHAIEPTRKLISDFLRPAVKKRADYNVARIQFDATVAKLARTGQRKVIDEGRVTELEEEMKKRTLQVDRSKCELLELMATIRSAEFRNLQESFVRVLHEQMMSISTSRNYFVRRQHLWRREPPSGGSVSGVDDAKGRGVGLAPPDQPPSRVRPTHIVRVKSRDIDGNNSLENSASSSSCASSSSRAQAVTQKTAPGSSAHERVPSTLSSSASSESSMMSTSNARQKPALPPVNSKPLPATEKRAWSAGGANKSLRTAGTIIRKATTPADGSGAGVGSGDPLSLTAWSAGSQASAPASAAASVSVSDSAPDDLPPVPDKAPPRLPPGALVEVVRTHRKSRSDTLERRLLDAAQTKKSGGASRRAHTPQPSLAGFWDVIDLEPQVTASDGSDAEPETKAYPAPSLVQKPPGKVASEFNALSSSRGLFHNHPPKPRFERPLSSGGVQLLTKAKVAPPSPFSSLTATSPRPPRDNLLKRSSPVSALAERSHSSPQRSPSPARSKFRPRWSSRKAKEHAVAAQTLEDTPPPPPPPPHPGSPYEQHPPPSTFTATANKVATRRLHAHSRSATSDFPQASALTTVLLKKGGDRSRSRVSRHRKSSSDFPLTLTHDEVAFGVSAGKVASGPKPRDSSASIHKRAQSAFVSSSPSPSLSRSHRKKPSDDASQKSPSSAGSSSKGFAFLSKVDTESESSSPPHAHQHESTTPLDLPPFAGLSLVEKLPAQDEVSSATSTAASKGFSFRAKAELESKSLRLEQRQHTQKLDSPSSPSNIQSSLDQTLLPGKPDNVLPSSHTSEPQNTSHIRTFSNSKTKTATSTRSSKSTTTLPRTSEKHTSSAAPASPFLSSSGGSGGGGGSLWRAPQRPSINVKDAADSLRKFGRAATGRLGITAPALPTLTKDSPLDLSLESLTAHKPQASTSAQPTTSSSKDLSRAISSHEQEVLPAKISIPVRQLESAPIKKARKPLAGRIHALNRAPKASTAYAQYHYTPKRWSAQRKPLVGKLRSLKSSRSRVRTLVRVRTRESTLQKPKPPPPPPKVDLPGDEVLAARPKDAPQATKQDSPATISDVDFSDSENDEEEFVHSDTELYYMSESVYFSSEDEDEDVYRNFGGGRVSSPRTPLALNSRSVSPRYSATSGVGVRQDFGGEFEEVEGDYYDSDGRELPDGWERISANNGESHYYWNYEEQHARWSRPPPAPLMSAPFRRRNSSMSSISSAASHASRRRHSLTNDTAGSGGGRRLPRQKSRRSILRRKSRASRASRRASGGTRSRVKSNLRRRDLFMPHQAGAGAASPIPGGDTLPPPVVASAASTAPSPSPSSASKPSAIRLHTFAPAAHISQPQGPPPPHVCVAADASLLSPAFSNTYSQTVGDNSPASCAGHDRSRKGSAFSTASTYSVKTASSVTPPSSDGEDSEFDGF